MRMRAKFIVDKLTPWEGSTSVNLSMHPVGADSYGPNGENEDNDFAHYTPGGSLEMTINNPEITEKIEVGQKYYLDFTPAD